MPKRDKYAAFHALDPFFEIILKGLEGLVDGEYFFDTMSGEMVFESLYTFPGWPRKQHQAPIVSLIERKARLKRLLRRKCSRILYIDHIEKHGQRFVTLPVKWRN
jgi:hypothetical protein